MINDLQEVDNTENTEIKDVNPLSEDTLKRIGNTVVEEYKADLASRSEWEKRAANWFKLFAGYSDPKTFPWKDCSNVHVPIVGVSVLQFAARAYEALIPAKEIVKCYATDGKSIQSANRASRYLNWQLTEQMEEWEEDMDILFLVQSIYGSAYKKTYYDPHLKRNVSRLLRPTEFVAPYACRRLEDAPRKTHMFYLSLNDIKIRVRDGVYYSEAGNLGQGSSSSNPSPTIQEQIDKVTGESQPSGTEHPRLILEQHRLWDLDNDGIQEPYIITVDYETGIVLSIQERRIVDQFGNNITLEYFTSYPFIPNPESHYGFGFGHLLEGINESANTLINQITDAGTLANLNGKTGFIAKRSGIKRGQIELELGRFIEVDAMTDDIRKAIYQFEFPEPSSVLFSLLGLLQQYAKEISSVSDSLLGKLPPSDTTATTMLAVMEQGMKVFSTIHKRNHRSLKKELKKIFFLNSIYLDERVYYVVQDSTSQDMATLESGRLDFANVIDVIPVSDPSITSRAEKLVKAQTVYQLVTTNPLMSQNPESLYYATRMVLEANEVASPNIEILLKKPEPVLPDLTPQEEHAQFLLEKDAHALPEQDHITHLDAHNIFLASTWGTQLTPQGKKLIDAHIREHLSMQYLKEEQAKQIIASKLMKAQMREMMQNGGIGRMEGMDGESMYEGVSQGASGNETGVS